MVTFTFLNDYMGATVTFFPLGPGSPTTPGGPASPFIKWETPIFPFHKMPNDEINKIMVQV